MPAEHIILEAVESSNLAAYGYNAEKRILAIQFKSGDIWHYAGVSLDTASAFGLAPSKGRFFVTMIKGQFPGDKMTGPCPACGDKGWIGETCTDCGTQRYVREEREPRT